MMAENSKLMERRGGKHVMSSRHIGKYYYKFLKIEHAWQVSPLGVKLSGLDLEGRPQTTLIIILTTEKLLQTL